MFNADINRKLDIIIRLLCRLLNIEEDLYMALDADVQKLVDQVTANTSATSAAVQAFQGQQQMISDLQTKVNEIKPNQPIDAEDLAAIQKAAADLAAANQALQAAVPANTAQPAAPSTPAGPAPTPSVPNP